MQRETIFRGEHCNPKKCDEHSDYFVPSRALQTKQHDQNEDVDRTHSDNDSGMADGREMKPRREANLINGHAEKAQIEKCPPVARGESSAPKSQGFRERRQSRAAQIC